MNVCYSGRSAGESNPCLCISKWIALVYMGYNMETATQHSNATQQYTICAHLYHRECAMDYTVFYTYWFEFVAYLVVCTSYRIRWLGLPTKSQNASYHM